jgi:hypothetical protein
MQETDTLLAKLEALEWLQGQMDCFTLETNGEAVVVGYYILP